MTQILAIIDPDRDSQTALQRCSELPLGADISVHVALFMPIVSAEKMASHDKSHPSGKKEKIEQLVEDYGLNKFEVTTEIVPFERLYESIIQTAYSCNADFIFKPLRKHKLVRRSLFTSTDWNLIRMCPLPLLLAGQLESIAGKPVIAALDVCTSDESHNELNRIVLSHAKVVANVISSKVHTLNAYALASTGWGYSASDPIPYQVAKAKQSDHHEEALKLSKEFEIEESHVTVREGAPTWVVNQYGDEIDAGMVVIGTVARSGLAGLFIGNTAETVLENSTVDVMVVKQADFQSPIKHR